MSEKGAGKRGWTIIWLVLLVGLPCFGGACSQDCPTQAAGNDEPPANPFLADSPWPMAHRNPYCQASSPVVGPSEAPAADRFGYLHGMMGLITAAFSGPYADGSRILWGTNLRSVYKVALDGEELAYIDKIPKEEVEGEGELLDAGISGAYTLVDADGTFFVPNFKKLYAYTDEVAGDTSSAIVIRDVYEIPAEHLYAEDDLIVGLNITHDGMLAFATKFGTIAVLSRDFGSARYLRLFEPVPAAGDEDPEEISNSIACDEAGGIYVVTSKWMYRVQWTGTELTIDESDGGWTAAYETGDDVSGPRLGPGSGSTPTLMGTGGQDRFVVITDGQPLMHLVLFWRDGIPADWERIPGTLDRRIAAQVPVTFGDAGAVESLSEQSVCVRGYGALVVNNQLRAGDFGPLLSVLFSGFPAFAPYGAEKFAWDPKTRELFSAWANEEVSLPNGIPAMSAATGLIYDVGQRDGAWTWEAIDWETGESAFHYPIGGMLKYNSVYAATEVGPDGALYSGALWGMMRLAP